MTIRKPLILRVNSVSSTLLRRSASFMRSDQAVGRSKVGNRPVSAENFIYVRAAHIRDKETSHADSMVRITILTAVALLQAASTASAERIKRKPPTEAEAARIASDQAMSDNLRKGDIVSTDRGFLQFRGFKQDGNPEFAPVPNPLSSGKR